MPMGTVGAPTLGSRFACQGESAADTQPLVVVMGQQREKLSRRFGLLVLCHDAKSVEKTNRGEGICVTAPWAHKHAAYHWLVD